MKKLSVLLLVLVSVMAMSLSACTSKVDFKISFIVDGKVYDTVRTTGDETIKMPTNPTKEGYTFDGWYWDNDTWSRPFTVNSLLDEPLSSDMSVYAKWKSNGSQSGTPQNPDEGQDDDPSVDPNNPSGGGETNPGGSDKPSPHVHSYGDWIKTPTEHYKKCDCGDETSKASHSLSYVSDGEEHYQKCSVCGYETDKESHRLSYVSDGEGHYQECSVCGYVTQKESHNLQYKIEDDKHYQKCSTCNYETAKEAHNYGNWKTTKEPTYTEDGLKKGSCVCGEETTQTVSKLDAFTYKQVSNGYAITGYKAGGSVVTVPDNYDNMSITTIADKAFYDCSTITEITLPDSIKEIGKEAFGYCTSLTKVTIPNVTRILDNAFVGCSNLVEITLPDSVVSLGSKIFDNCGGLRKVTILSGSVSASLFGNCSGIEELTIGEKATVERYAFSNFSNLNTLTMPKVDTTTSFMRYYFGITPESYTLYVTETCSDLPDDIYPDEVDRYTYGNRVFGVPRSYTSWYYYRDTITVGGKTYVYDDKPVKVTKWRDAYDYTVNVRYNFPESWSAHFYCNADTPLRSLTVTNQMISVYNEVFEECNCAINIVQKFPIKEVSVVGKEELFIDEFNAEDYSIRVVYEDNFSEKFPLFDYISEEDKKALSTDGEHTITATYKDKSCMATIKLNLHKFENVTLESQHFIVDGSIKALSVIGAPEGTEIKYEGNDQSEVGDYTVTATLSKQYYETMTLSATLKLVKPEYTINYEIGLENFTNDNPEKYTSDGDDINLSDPIRFGYEFLGWYTEAEFNYRIYTIKGGAYTDYTLYAKWRTVFTISGNSITGLTDYGKKQNVLIIDSVINNTIITSIAENAFKGCSNLQDITIPESVTSIGGSAFYNCNSLTETMMPANVTSIGSSAFYNCSRLEKVTISSLAAWCKINFADSSANPLYYAKHLYIGEDEMTTLNIPNEVTTISSYAFYGCSNLQEVTIPESVTSIGSSAFYGCSRLKKATTSNLAAWCKINFASSSANPLYYAEHLYVGEDELATLEIPNEITEIKSYAFYNCSNLAGVTFEGETKLETIGNSAFYNCSGLSEITIPESVTSIGSSAFYNCSNLEKVTTNNLTAWCKINFASSSANPLSRAGHLYVGENEVTTLEIPNETTEIKSYAFYNCSGLTGELKIPESVTTIDSSAFYGCSGLTSVTIGESVTSIGSYAFSGCSGLTSVTIGENVTSIGNHAFYGCSSLTSVTIGESVTTIGERAFSGCSGLKCELKIPDSVTTIGWGAFEGCSGLTSVTIPNSVTSIGDYAFYNCNGLTSVTIGESVTWIGKSAFFNCNSLTSVEFKNPDNWQVSYYSSFSSPTSISNLSNPSTAAGYLRSTYYKYYWRRTK